MWRLRNHSRPKGGPCSPCIGPDGSARPRRCAGSSRKRRWSQGISCCRCSSPTASPSRARSPRCPASCSTRMDSLRKAAVDAVSAGVGGLMLFGVPRPEDKDAAGTAASEPDGILNRGLAALRDEVGAETVVMADTCLDEFTDHGHCGVLAPDGSVDNDALAGPLRRHGARAGRRRGAPARHQRHDGRPGRRDPHRARRRRARRHRHHRLRRQIRLRVLRPVPRGRRVVAAG